MELKKMIAESEKVQVFVSDDKCVKVFKDADEPKSVVLYEALTHTRVEETGFGRIPPFEGITTVDGKWAIIYRHISGKTMDELMREKPKKREEFLDKMADLQVEINSLKTPKLSRLKDYIKRSIDGLDMIDDVKKYELLTRLKALPEINTLCHGDFSPDNIIVNSDGVYIVDWLKAKQGNPAADVAKTYLNFCLKHRTEAAEKYLKIYCAKTGIPSSDIYDWLPIVAAAQLKFKRPEERELLLTWIDIADFSN